MKIVVLHPIYVAPNFRQEIVEGEVRSELDMRTHQTEFVRRGIAAIRQTQRTGNGVPASEVLARLEARLSAARQTLAQRGR